VSSTPCRLTVPKGKGLRVTGIILASVGVAAVATGVGLSLKAKQPFRPRPTAKTVRTNVRRSRPGVWVSYGVGAAAIATGAILYIVGRQATSPPVWLSYPS